MEEMIRLGAYRQGTNADVDEAIAYHPALERFLAQRHDDCCDLASGYAELARILEDGPHGEIHGRVLGQSESAQP